MTFISWQTKKSSTIKILHCKQPSTLSQKKKKKHIQRDMVSTLSISSFLVVSLISLKLMIQFKFMFYNNQNLHLILKFKVLKNIISSIEILWKIFMHLNNTIYFLSWWQDPCLVWYDSYISNKARVLRFKNITRSNIHIR